MKTLCCTILLTVLEVHGCPLNRNASQVSQWARMIHRSSSPFILLGLVKLSWSYYLLRSEKKSLFSYVAFLPLSCYVSRESVYCSLSCSIRIIFTRRGTSLASTISFYHSSLWITIISVEIYDHRKLQTSQEESHIHTLASQPVRGWYGVWIFQKGKFHFGLELYLTHFAWITFSFSHLSSSSHRRPIQITHILSLACVCFDCDLNVCTQFDIMNSLESSSS